MTAFRSSLKYILFLAILCGGTESVFAKISLPTLGKTATKVEADPKKEYTLKDSDGNWFVLATKFGGDDARLKANRLAFELRKKYKLPAFVYEFDPDKEDADALSKRDGGAKKYRYQTVRLPEYGVFVGGYPTVDDLALQDALEKVCRMQPESLANDAASQEIVKHFKSLANTNKKYAGYGPLGKAFPVTNPLIPKGFYNQKGIVDPFIAKINSDSKYSLLNNPKLYTVRIATFTGDSDMFQDNQKADELQSRLQYAGMRAAAMCEALRKSGVEAWEFHDRDCSFVTVGSFDEYGVVQPDGHTELNPKVAEIMKKYGGELCRDGELCADGSKGEYKAFSIVVDVPDPNSTRAKPKKTRMQLSCDVRPVLIVVPQRSGEENVRKLALAQAKMERAEQVLKESAFERSVATKGANVDLARHYAAGETISEEEFARTLEEAKRATGQTTAQTVATPAQTQAANAAQTPQTVQNAATSVPYTAQNRQIAANAQNAPAPQIVQNARSTQTAATSQRYSRPAQTAQTTQVAQNVRPAQNPQTVKAARPTQPARQAAPQATAQAPQPYGTAARTAKTAQKSAAPTY